jgi:RNA polymerase sigma-70 factor (sigma-E family)
MGKRVDRDVEFRRFALAFTPALLRTARLLIGDQNLAEDAVQTTMLQVFRRWDRAREAPEAYSRTALVNVCRDLWRRQLHRPQEILSADLPEQVMEACFAEDVDRREALRQALNELPIVQREVLVLRYFADLSVEQTSEILGVPNGTIKSAASRGLERLRVLLTATLEEEAC